MNDPVIFEQAYEKVVRSLENVRNNHVLFASIAAWIIAQIIKTLINWGMSGKLSVSRLWGDGGMPSCHSATVVALSVMTGWATGFGNPVFAFACVFAVVVMHDATGVRRETGKQAATIKEIVAVIGNTFAGKDKDVQAENLKVLVGRSPLQVFFGGLLGGVIAILYITVFHLPYLFAVA